MDERLRGKVAEDVRSSGLDGDVQRAAGVGTETGTGDVQRAGRIGMETGKAQRVKRLAWFVALYAGSAVAFAAVTYGLRAIIPR